MNNQQLQKRMLQNWNSRFQEGENWRESEVRKLRSEKNNFSFLVFFNESKGRYYERGEAQRDLQSSTTPFGHILKNPKLKYKHFIIRSSKTSLTRGHLMFIADSPRPELRPRDILVLSEIAMQTDYCIFVNLKGSGATVPAHFHAQGHLIEYSVTNKTTGAKLKPIYSNGRVQLTRLVYPSYGISLTTQDPETKQRLGKRLEDMQEKTPFNLLFFNDRILVYPRTKEKPSCFEDWTMGGFEMGGVFCTRDPKMFRNLDYRTAEFALRDVTYQDKTQQERFEKTIGDALNG